MVAIVVTIVGTVRAMPCIQLRGSIPLPERQPSQTRLETGPQELR